MFLSFFCIASEYQPLCNNQLFGGFAPPAAWQTSAVFFIVLRLENHRRVLHFYLEIALWETYSCQYALLINYQCVMKVSNECICYFCNMI